MDSKKRKKEEMSVFETVPVLKDNIMCLAIQSGCCPSDYLNGNFVIMKAIDELQKLKNVINKQQQRKREKLELLKDCGCQTIFNEAVVHTEMQDSDGIKISAPTLRQDYWPAVSVKEKQQQGLKQPATTKAQYGPYCKDKEKMSSKSIQENERTFLSLTVTNEPTDMTEKQQQGLKQPATTKAQYGPYCKDKEKMSSKSIQENERTFLSLTVTNEPTDMTKKQQQGLKQPATTKAQYGPYCKDKEKKISSKSIQENKRTFLSLTVTNEPTDMTKKQQQGLKQPATTKAQYGPYCNVQDPFTQGSRIASTSQSQFLMPASPKTSNHALKQQNTLLNNHLLGSQPLISPPEIHNYPFSTLPHLQMWPRFMSTHPLHNSQIPYIKENSNATYFSSNHNFPTVSSQSNYYPFLPNSHPMNYKPPSNFK